MTKLPVILDLKPERLKRVALPAWKTVAWSCLIYLILGMGFTLFFYGVGLIALALARVLADVGMGVGAMIFGGVLARRVAPAVLLAARRAGVDVSAIRLEL